MALIDELEERVSWPRLGRTNKKVCDVWGIPGLELTRWKFNEFDYYQAEKARLPITARGLFTLGDRIAVRGYNKFFNIGEVRTTKLEFLESQLAEPFYATVKENGYLVLIAGYKGKLVVTSKNSSGECSTNEEGRNYSQTAREWVLKNLESSGKTEKELANLLEANNWTACGELCDDSFEEHVLEYDEQMAGIYLNGLNKNEARFQTESPDVVQRVADEFGFKRTEFLEFPDFTHLMEFLEQGQQTGKFGTRDVEGFVIRAKLKDTGDDFFFKFKFEEPYLMYREWREVVRELLTDESRARFRASRSRHRSSAMTFLRFAKEYLKEHPDLAYRLQHYNLGVIELRNAFFQSANGEAATTEALLGLDISVPKYLLVTVATLGCGKSTVANTLVGLLPSVFGHRQNDSMKGGKGTSKFGKLLQAIMDDFCELDVVTLDRNNPSRQERQQIFDEFGKRGYELGFDIQFIGLNFLPDGPAKASKELTRSRVFSRGDKHETIKVSEMTEKGVSAIMSQFEGRFQVVNKEIPPDNQFQLVIDLEAGESKKNVRTILNELRAHYPKLAIPEFSDEQIDTVFEQVRKQEASRPIVAPKINNRKKLKKLTYFGVHVDEKNELLQKVHELMPEMGGELKLKNEWHVTLAHKNSHEQFTKMLEEMGPRLDEFLIVPGEVRDIKVTELAWTPEVAACRAEVAGCANSVAHITIALKKGVAAVDANKLFNGEFKEEVIERRAFNPIVIRSQKVFGSY